MAKHDVHFCPNCNTKHQLSLDNTSVLACVKCFTIITTHPEIKTKPDAAPIGDDWSFVQIGTRGEYNKLHFTVVGRVRVQLRNDYKNFWCAALDNGKNLWIIESFASFIVTNPGWTIYTESVNHLRAGKSIAISKDVKHIGEYVEKCEAISFQGEIGPWKFFRGGFFVVQAAARSKAASVFFLDSKNPNDTAYLNGGKTDIEDLKLTNIITWNEWV